MPPRCGIELPAGDIFYVGAAPCCAGLYQLVVKVPETLGPGNTSGTDHLSFDRAGLNGWQFIQDRIDYRPRRHHTNFDVVDGLVPEDLMVNAVVMATFAYHAAMRDELLPRKDAPAGR